MERWRQVATFFFAMALGSVLTWFILQRQNEPMTLADAHLATTSKMAGRSSSQRNSAGRANSAQGAAAQHTATKNKKAVQVDLQPLGANKATGTLTFLDLGKDGVRLDASLRNLQPGQYQLNIHETGDCSAPDGSSVGSILAAQPEPIAPLVANVMGRTQGSFVLTWTSLTESPTGLLGRAVVVGNGEVVLACGVVR